MSNKIRILYIDDYELDRELVKDALEKEHMGFKVTEASNRQEFEALLKTSEFDAVLSDFNIAGFEGLQVLEAVRAHNPKIPVIIVTGTGSEEIAVKAMQQGASDYVIKRPKHILKLPQTILAAIEKKTLREQRKLAKEMLQYSEKQYRSLFNSIRDAILVVDTNRQIIDCNPAFIDLFGYSKKKILGKQTIIIYENKEEFRRMGSAIKDHMGDPGFLYPVRYQKENGSVFLGETNVFYMRDDEDTIVGFIGLIRDITERKRVEKEHEKLQEKLQQAQKMESVGRLAGGVAHDYNNALTTIMGYTELALMDADPKGPLHDDLNQILKAGRRATDITRQLLAFARKQTIAPVVLDLNETVESMLKMLRRLIGEDIDLVWMPGKDLGNVKMDPSQIDQILANLCVNARDAIEGVGKITIEMKKIFFDEDYCADHTGFIPGEFVLLAVSDNGCGMDKEILNNIFEPFFTTKPVDKGTGLGLSTVFGIVKQNNGFINVYSEPGKGTSIKIYLPQHEDETVEILKENTAKIPQGQGETILMVEDDLSILKLAEKMLKGLNYTVLIAGTPKGGIRLAKDHTGEIHLLVTDVIMPEMNGLELSKQLKLLYPDLKCIFMSGYTANAIAHHGVLDEGVHFVQKPFAKKDLASIVRKVLEE
ncbi:response regulator [Desulfobacula sp.]|uniref:response regulator n=1 Tax=Desulfobacula sp. TaxID=2593537 RepID=UPI001EB24E0B|nr:response regulator [Desulfobacula sp.]